MVCVARLLNHVHSRSHRVALSSPYPAWGSWHSMRIKHPRQRTSPPKDATHLETRRCPSSRTLVPVLVALPSGLGGAQTANTSRASTVDSDQAPRRPSTLHWLAAYAHKSASRVMLVHSRHWHCIRCRAVRANILCPTRMCKHVLLDRAVQQTRSNVAG
jgi:hypothetical protein